MDPRESKLALERNQAWWETLKGARSTAIARSSSRSSAVKLYAMTCGWLSADVSLMLARESGQIRFPIPTYLIHHPKGYVLFDTGLHPESGHDPHGRIGTLANFFNVHFRPGEDIASRLEQLEIDPRQIAYLVNSHLHFDHSGGNELIPNAKVIIQQKEWEAGHTPEFVEANAYNMKDYDHGHLVHQVHGEHDVFGDGTLVTIPTFGHTPGHQSLLVRLEAGDVVLAADACYFRQTLEELHLPKLVHDRSQMLDSLLLLRRMRARGARIFYGHDPDFWKEVPQAPMEIT